MVADKENIMNAVSSLGFEVFRNGQFHYNSSNTPDMYINQDGSIHCWTSSPFKNNTSNHGDLIDFLQMINLNQTFKEAKEEAEKLTGLTLPSLDSYKDNGYTIDNTNRKTGFIDEEFIKNFEVGRYENFERFKVLLNEALPSLDFDKQKELALKYQIGYIEMSDRLSMPIKDEENRIVTLWKYNKNPNNYINENGIEVTPNKVLFTKGRDRCPFNLYDMQEFRKDISKDVFLCAGEKDTLNMVGNGFRAVTLGAENENLKDKYKPLFQDLSVVIAYDNDIAGEKGIVKIYEQLKEVAKEVKIFDWREVEKQGIELKKGFDMTDYLVAIKEKGTYFNINYKNEDFVNELKSKIEEEKNQKTQSKQINNKDSKMANLKLIGKNDSLNIQANNALQYSTKTGEVKERQNITAFLDVVKEASSVADMNKGVVTLSAKSQSGDYNSFFVNNDKETGNIILKATSDPQNEALFIIFDKKTKQDGNSYYQLNDFNGASELIKNIDINSAGNKKFLGVNLNLKNDEIKEALQEKGKDYTAVLTHTGYEIKHNLDLYSKKDNTAVESIKSDINQNGTTKPNYGAMDSIRDEMTKPKEEVAQTNNQVEKNNNQGMVNFNFNIPSGNKEVIAAFESLMKALKVQNIDTNVEVKKQETTQQQGYGARTQK